MVNPKNCTVVDFHYMPVLCNTVRTASLAVTSSIALLGPNRQREGTETDRQNKTQINCAVIPNSYKLI